MSKDVLGSDMPTYDGYKKGDLVEYNFNNEVSQSLIFEWIRG